MSERPVLAPPDPDALARACAAVGLPAPERVVAPERAWVHANYRLVFPAASGVRDRLLRRALVVPGLDTLANEHAALTLLRGLDEVPVVREFRIVPAGLLPFPAAISSLLPGRDGMRWMRERPDLAPEVARTVGRVMARLVDLPLARFGTRGDEGLFVPQRRTWREEWEAHLAFWTGTARAAGTDLGPVGARLLEQVRERLPALEEVTVFGLVHGDLHPGNLLLALERDRIALTGVVDWEESFVGDPLAVFAQALQLPPSTLGHVVAGYGPDRVRALLEPGPLARLEVYALSRSLLRLGFAGLPLLEGGRGRRRAAALAYARVLCGELADEGAVRRRLEEALASGTAGAVVPWPKPAAEELLRSRALEAFRHAPLPGRGRVGAVAAALALTPRARGPGAQDVARLGERLLDTLGPMEVPLHAEPIADRPVHRRALIAAIADRPESHPQAIAVLGLALDAVDRVEGAVPDAVLRGIESVVRGLLEAETRKPGPHTGLPLVRDLLVAAAGATLLGEAPLADTLRERARRFWEEVTVKPVAAPQALVDRVASWLGGEEDPVWGALVLWAVDVLGAERLPDDPGVVIEALTRG